MRSDNAELCTGDSHDQCSRNTLSRDVTNAEIHPFISDKEVKEVSTDALGCFQHTIDINIVAIRKRRESLLQHRHLYVAGDTQLALH